ncbi:hypothetical protein [Prosthecomicrobium sp. N25]
MRPILIPIVACLALGGCNTTSSSAGVGGALDSRGRRILVAC